MMTKGSKQVLVMDSGEWYRTSMERCLRRYRIPVVTATSFQRSLELLREKDIGVVVTDAVDVTGNIPSETYLRQLRTMHGPRRYVPIIAWTHPNPVVGSLRTELPIDMVISKRVRYDPERFRACVEHLLEQPEAYREQPRLHDPKEYSTAELWSSPHAREETGPRRTSLASMLKR